MILIIMSLDRIYPDESSSDYMSDETSDDEEVIEHEVIEHEVIEDEVVGCNDNETDNNTSYWNTIITFMYILVIFYCTCTMYDLATTYTERYVEHYGRKNPFCDLRKDTVMHSYKMFDTDYRDSKIDCSSMILSDEWLKCIQIITYNYKEKIFKTIYFTECYSS